MNDKEELICRLKNFINGEDISIKNANCMEILIERLFPFDEDMQDFITLLAMYTPEGGDYLYDRSRILPDAKYVLKKINI